MKTHTKKYLKYKHLYQIRQTFLIVHYLTAIRHSQWNLHEERSPKLVPNICWYVWEHEGQEVLINKTHQAFVPTEWDHPFKRVYFRHTESICKAVKLIRCATLNAAHHYALYHVFGEVKGERKKKANAKPTTWNIKYWKYLNINRITIYPCLLNYNFIFQSTVHF